MYALRPLISSVLLLFGVSINTIGDFFDSIGNLIDSIMHIFGNGIQSISKYPMMGGNGNNWNDNDAKGGYMSGGNSKSSGGIAKPDDTTNPIQQSTMSQNKQSWCLVGNSPGSRTCVPVSDVTKCMSGLTYDDQQTCTNPIVSPSNPMNQTMSGKGSNNGSINGSNNGSTSLSFNSPTTSNPSVFLQQFDNQIKSIKQLPPNQQYQQILQLINTMNSNPLIKNNTNMQNLFQKIDNIPPDQQISFSSIFLNVADKELSQTMSVVEPITSFYDSSITSKNAVVKNIKTTQPKF